MRAEPAHFVSIAGRFMITDDGDAGQTFFRMLEIDNQELSDQRDAMDQLRNGDYHGILVRNVFDSAYRSQEKGQLQAIFYVVTDRNWQTIDLRFHKLLNDFLHISTSGLYRLAEIHP